MAGLDFNKEEIMLTFEEARKLAEAEAESYFSSLVDEIPKTWLSENVLEEDNCWLFLKGPNIRFRSDSASWADTAFVVSRRGTVLTVADHHEDAVELKSYLQKVSAYLEARNE